MKPINKYKIWFMTFLFIVGIIIVYKYIDSFSVITTFFSNIIGILSPFIIGFVIAYILNLPTKKINGFLDEIIGKASAKNKKSKLKLNTYKLSVLLIYIFAVVLISLVLKLIIPPLYKNIADLCQNMPSYISSAVAYIETLPLENILPAIDIDEIISFASVKRFFASIDLSSIGKYAQSVMGVTSNVINIFIGIIISIYMLLDKDKIKKFMSDFSTAFFPEKIDKTIKLYLKEANDTFPRFISCQLIDAVVVSTLASILLSLLKVKYSLVLGIMLGVFNLIPYFGAIIACVISIVITLFTGGVFKALWTAVTLLIIQQIDGNIIGPKIMGDQLDISPLLVIFAVTVGGGLFGIIGMLISVPVVAVIKRFLTGSVERRVAKKLSEATLPEDENI